MHTILEVGGRPAGHVLEETDGTDAAVGAEIKPVPRAQRHTDHVAGTHFDCKHRAINRVDVKHTSSLQNKPHFVLGMGVFAAKPLEHGIEVERVGIDIDHVCRNEASAFFKLINFCRVGRQNGFCWCRRIDAISQRPDLVADVATSQKALHLASIGDPAGFGWDSDNGHGGVFLFYRMGLSAGLEE